MYVLKITDEYDKFVSCTDNGNYDIIIIIKFLLLSIPSGKLLLIFMSLKIWTMIKPLING